MTVKDVETYYQGVVKKQDENILALKTQNAELLEALKEAKYLLTVSLINKENGLKQIQSAIAKAEGE